MLFLTFGETGADIGLLKTLNESFISSRSKLESESIDFKLISLESYKDLIVQVKF